MRHRRRSALAILFLAAAIAKGQETTEEAPETGTAEDPLGIGEVTVTGTGSEQRLRSRCEGTHKE